MIAVANLTKRYVLGLGSPPLWLALVCLGAAAGGLGVLLRLYGDLLLWKVG